MMHNYLHCSRPQISRDAEKHKMAASHAKREITLNNVMIIKRTITRDQTKMENCHIRKIKPKRMGHDTMGR